MFVMLYGFVRRDVVVFRWVRVIYIFGANEFVDFFGFLGCILLLLCLFYRF